MRMKLSENQILFTLNIGDLIFFANSIGIGMTFGEAYRTEYQQKEYLRTGKSKTLNSIQSQFKLKIDLIQNPKNPIQTKINNKIS